MKKNSLNPAVAALLASGLVVLGVAAPANAETVEPTAPDVTNTATEEPGLGAEEELPTEVPTPAAPVEEEPTTEPTQEPTPTEEPTAEPTEEPAPVETPAPEVTPNPTPSPSTPTEEPPAEEVKAPATPVLTVVKVTDSGATVTVGAGEGAGETKSFEVTVSSLDGTYTSTEGLDAKGGTVDFGTLEAKTTYNVSVIARGPGGENYAASSFTTLDNAPAKPFVEIGEITFNSADVTVTAGEGGGELTGYTISLTAKGLDPVVIDSPADGGTRKFGGLEPETDYTATVVANGPGGTATTSAMFTTPKSPVAVPATPAIAVDSTKDSITVSVKDASGTPVNEEYPTKFQVELVAPDGSGTSTVLDSEGAYTFTGLPAATAYTVNVLAFNVAGYSSAASVEVTTKATPVAPAPEQLTDDTRGGVEVPANAEAGKTVTINVGKELAGQTVNGWLFSVATDLGTAVVAADGTATFTIPAGVPAGNHRLAVMNDENVLVGWGNLAVAAADSGETPVIPAPEDNGNAGGNTDNGTDNNAGENTVGTPAAENGTNVAASGNTADTLAATGTESPAGLVAAAALMLGLGAFITGRRRKLAGQN